VTEHYIGIVVLIALAVTSCNCLSFETETHAMITRQTYTLCTVGTDRALLSIRLELDTLDALAVKARPRDGQIRRRS